MTTDPTIQVNNPLEVEIIDALRAIGPNGGSGVQISHWIEDRSPKRAWRFLWWHGEAERIIPFGTMYRALDKLAARGILTRTRYNDSDPPRFVYRLVASLDADLRRMGQDAEYQAEAKRIDAEFGQ